MEFEARLTDMAAPAIPEDFRRQQDGEEEDFQFSTCNTLEAQPIMASGLAEVKREAESCSMTPPPLLQRIYIGPPLSGPTLFPGHLPTIEASIAETEASTIETPRLTEPLRGTEAPDIVLSAAESRGPSRAPSPSSPPPPPAPSATVTERSIQQGEGGEAALQAILAQLPPEAAGYLDEFDAWLRANFGYGRGSKSETEALERSLMMGGDVPGAVRVSSPGHLQSPLSTPPCSNTRGAGGCILQVPFLARKYYARQSARKAAKQSVEDVAQAEPPWMDPERPRPTQGYVDPRSGLEPLYPSRMRFADVEMSMRPSQPQYFQGTYEALVGNLRRWERLSPPLFLAPPPFPPPSSVLPPLCKLCSAADDALLFRCHRSVNIGDARRGLKPLFKDKAGQVAAGSKSFANADGRRDLGAPAFVPTISSRPATPLGFAYAKGMDEATTKASRLEGLNADFGFLQIKGVQAPEVIGEGR